jgi:hypothetical protein
MLNREEQSDGLFGPSPLSELTSSGWVTISDLARCEGVTKTAISRRVARLASQNGLETRTGTNRAKEVKLDRYEKITGKRFDPSRIPLDEISRLAVRGEISSLQLMTARHYRLIWRARDAQLLRKASSLLSGNDVDLCRRLLLHDQSLNEIARRLHYVRRSLLHRLWTCLDTLTREFFHNKSPKAAEADNCCLFSETADQFRIVSRNVARSVP